MKCPKCNKNIPDGGRYCPYCGNRSLLPNQSYPAHGDELTTAMGALEDEGDELTTAIQSSSSSQGSLSGPAKGFRFNDVGRSRSICTDDPTAQMLQNSATNALNNDYGSMPGTQSLNTRQQQGYNPAGSYSASAQMNEPAGMDQYSNSNYRQSYGYEAASANSSYSPNPAAGRYGYSHPGSAGGYSSEGYASGSYGYDAPMQNGYRQDGYSSPVYAQPNAGQQPRQAKGKKSAARNRKRKKGPKNVWKYIAIVLIIVILCIAGWFAYQHFFGGSAEKDEPVKISTEISTETSNSSSAPGNSSSMSSTAESSSDASATPAAQQPENGEPDSPSQQSNPKGH